MECTGIERDNLFQEFRDIIAANMNVTRIEIESSFRKLNEKVMELGECAVQERKFDLEDLKEKVDYTGASQRDKWNESNNIFDIKMRKIGFRENSMLGLIDNVKEMQAEMC
jgi:hypothetical protein